MQTRILSNSLSIRIIHIDDELRIVHVVFRYSTLNTWLDIKCLLISCLARYANKSINGRIPVPLTMIRFVPKILCFPRFKHLPKTPEIINLSSIAAWEICLVMPFLFCLLNFINSSIESDVSLDKPSILSIHR